MMEKFQNKKKNNKLFMKLLQAIHIFVVSMIYLYSLFMAIFVQKYILG